MIRTLISDLGNVILHFDHRIIRARLRHDFPDVAWDDEKEGLFWALVKSFELGEVDEAGFLRETGLLLGLQMELDEEHFRRLWSDIFWLNDEYLSLLMRAKESSLTLVMLSNTNALHIDWARRQFPEVFEVFDHEVFSFGLHTAKPDRRIYQEALRLADVEADQAIYFDDIASYADAASALGIHGHQFVSVQGARDVLEMHELIGLAHQ